MLFVGGGLRWQGNVVGEWLRRGQYIRILIGIRIHGIAISLIPG